MENAQLAAARNSDFANAAREELMETKLRVDSLTAQLNQYQTQVVFLVSVKFKKQAKEYLKVLTSN